MVPDPFFLVVAGLLGAILGSFLNAVTFRYNTGQPLWKAMQGRSHCMRCGHELGFFDLVPIFSWILLCGACRYCTAKISIQYPLVEILSAMLSLGIAAQFIAGRTVLPVAAIAGYFFWLLVWMTILFLVIYDWRHMILPMGGLALLAALGMLSLFFNCFTAVMNISGCHFVPPSLWPFLAGPFLAAPLLLLSLISRGRWMGWGDGIFALPLGWLLGLAGGFTALILAFWVGAIVGIALLAIQTTGVTMKSEIPFGPFLALGSAIAFFTHFNLFIILGIG